MCADVSRARLTRRLSILSPLYSSPQLSTPAEVEPLTDTDAVSPAAQCPSDVAPAVVVKPRPDVVAGLVAEMLAQAKAEPVAPVVKLAPHVQRLAQLQALKALKASPEPEPKVDAPAVEPEPSPEPEPPAPAAREASPSRQQASMARPGDLILDRKAPYDTARIFLEHLYSVEAATVSTLRYWQGQFYRWDGSFYEVVDDDIFEAQIRTFLAEARVGTGRQGVTEPFQPMDSHVREVFSALRGNAIPKKCNPPMWLDTQQPAKEYVAFRNGVVNVHTGEMQSHSWRFWTHSIRPFDWKPEAQCPVWERFLEEVFPRDSESQAFIEEWMGYCMTEDVELHKGAMFIGKKGRNGKGTIAHVIRELVGRESYVPLNFDTWVKTENSTAPIIGKRVGCFGDVRLKQGKEYGDRFYDPGGLNHISQALLLLITGGDPVSIGRKYLGPWDGVLPTKLIIISNEVPNLNDPTLTLVKRFIKVNFTQDFYGREDIEP